LSSICELHFKDFSMRYLISLCLCDSALMLLVGQQKGIWPVKLSGGGCWHGYLSGVRCRLACGPADATAIHCLLLQ